MAIPARARSWLRPRRGALAVLAIAVVVPSVALMARSDAAQGAGGGRGRAADAAAAARAEGIRLVGRAETFTSGSSQVARTALPPGTAAGDLVVSIVSTYAFSTVRFASGWTTAYDVSRPDGVRMVVAYRLGGRDLRSGPQASVSPSTEVSMATVALRDVDPRRPVETAKGTEGAVGPSVPVQTPGAVLLLTHASTAWQFTPKPPPGATVTALARNSGNSEAAIALTGPLSPGTAGPQPWAAVPAGTSDAVGAVVLRPAVPRMPAEGTGPSAATPSGTTGGSPTVAPAPTVAVAPPAGVAPAAPPARPCSGIAPAGPSSPPAGAITVSPGQNLGDVVDGHGPGTTYWLAPGVHALGDGAYDQVIPHAGDTFLGAPGAILDGRHRNLYAFTGQATDVRISHLTVQNFGAAGQNSNEGVLNHDSARNWTISSNLVQRNAGAAVMIGSGNRVTGNCIRDNGQYAFNAYHPSGVSDVVLDSNEISGNNTDDWEKRLPGCGCTGGGKFWATRGARITNNYVHDNRGVGIWADTNNAGFLFQGNYISGNDAEGIMYETSYNAAILNNTFLRNAIVKGPTNPGFPTAAIYLSESGSDRRVPGEYGDRLRISGNVFTDNWAGIVAWENADRFAGSPANTSTGASTLVNPAVATEAACADGLKASGAGQGAARTVLLSDCRWKTVNVLVEQNTFVLRAAALPACTPANGCGFNGLFSNYGTYPSWSPYKGETVAKAITFGQNNLWRANTYRGPWNFVATSTGHVIGWSAWRSAPYRQDAGSTLRK